jgi:DNA-binding response OmpR family regulator
MKLLVIEDEPRMNQLLRRGLMEDGHTVDTCESAAQASERMQYADYDVIILDWGLPDADGVSLLKSWRNKGVATPVLMLTARGSSGERVLGLRSGADDFLVKPFDFQELTARLEALHRRAGAMQLGAATLGDIEFRRSERVLACGAAHVELTSREFQLFAALASRPGDVRTRSEILAQVWGSNFDGDPNVVDVYIGYLRNKLDSIKTQRVAITTVRGTGYRLTITAAPSAPSGAATS